MKRIPQLSPIPLVHLLWICQASLLADPLDEWTLRTPLPTGNYLHDVTYGNQQFVAVGNVGQTLVSSDGITWSVRTVAANVQLGAITFGNGLWVLTGSKIQRDSTTGEWENYGMILTSPDGFTWNVQASISRYAFNGIAYGNGQFVSVGEHSTHQSVDSGAIWTSPDGITWTTRNASTTNSLYRVAFGESQFVAVGDLGTIVTSVDGVNWTPRDSGVTDRLRAIAYGNQQFVAASNVTGSGHVVTSSDGQTWTASEGAGGDALAFGNNLFVSVGGPGYGGPNSAIIRTSFNGATWTDNSYSGTDFRLNAITYGNGRFVAVGDSGAIVTSLDGLSWNSRTARTTRDGLFALAYANGRFVGVGGSIVTSRDGTTWTNIPAPVRTNTTRSWYSGIAYGAGKFVAVGGAQNAQDYSQFNGAIITSSDGLTWIDHNSGTTNELLSVVYGKNQFAAVGALGTILTSPDGLNWTSRHSGETAWDWLPGIAYGNNQFVAVGGRWPHPGYVSILTSPDGITWTGRALGSNAGGRDGIAYGNNVFVAVGNSPAPVLTSPDGITWTSRNSGDDGELHAIAFGHGTFVALGLGKIVISSDFITWRILSTTDNLSAIAYGNSSFVAVGDAGTILQSGVLAPMQPALAPLKFLSNGEAQVTLMGLAGQSYSVQASTNLAQWTDLATVVLINSSGQFVDHFATNVPQRFYRAVLQ